MKKPLSSRARRLLEFFQNPDRVIWEDTYADGKVKTYRFCELQDNDGWTQVYPIPQIGLATILELIEAGIVEERYPQHYRKQGTFASQRYRLRRAEPFPEHEDFGDLWVAP